MTKRGFTLVELLVSISIIALLVTILYPSLSRAKEVARRGICQGNIKELVKACTMFASSGRENRGPNDTPGALPITSTVPTTAQDNRNCLWLLVTGQYVGPNTFLCPSASGLTPADVPTLSNPGGMDWSNCGYSYQSMLGVDAPGRLPLVGTKAAGRMTRDNTPFNMVLIADANPRFAGGAATPTAEAGASFNHGQQGQAYGRWDNFAGFSAATSGSSGRKLPSPTGSGDDDIYAASNNNPNTALSNLDIFLIP